MRVPQRRPEPRGAAWALAVMGSAALHVAALAAVLAWTARPAPAPGEAEGVALVFADTVALAGREAAPAEAAPAIPPTPEPAAPSASDPATPSPPVDPPASAAPPAVAALPVPDPPAEVPPPDPVPAPAAEPLPTPPPPPPPPEAAARVARPTPPARQVPVRLDAGAGALPDGSLGARAVGAVVPPGPASGQRNAPPGYPAESRRRGEEGVVRLLLHLDADGGVQEAEIVATSGHAALDRAAVAAARRWRFRPATQGGVPVAARLATAVHFRLNER